MKIENNFEKKAAEIQILSDIIVYLNERLTTLTTDYRIIGKEEEQAIDWRTKQPKWEDEEHTIPHYDDKWGYVDIPEDELDDKTKLLANACRDIAKKLEKLA